MIVTGRERIDETDKKQLVTYSVILTVTESRRAFVSVVDIG